MHQCVLSFLVHLTLAWFLTLLSFFPSYFPPCTFLCLFLFSTVTSFLHLSSFHSTFLSACPPCPCIALHVALFKSPSFIYVCPQSPLSFCKVSSFLDSTCSPFCLHHTFLQFFSFIFCLYLLFTFVSTLLCVCSGCAWRHGVGFVGVAGATCVSHVEIRAAAAGGGDAVRGGALG